MFLFRLLRLCSAFRLRLLLLFFYLFLLFRFVFNRFFFFDGLIVVIFREKWSGRVTEFPIKKGELMTIFFDKLRALRVIGLLFWADEVKHVIFFLLFILKTSLEVIVASRVFKVYRSILV